MILRTRLNQGIIAGAIAATAALLPSMGWSQEIASCGIEQAGTGHSPSSQWYQIGKQLADQGLYQIAYRAFEESVESGLAQDFSSQVGAIDCLTQIQSVRKGNLLALDPAVVSRLARQVSTNGKAREILQAYSFRALLSYLGASEPGWKKNQSLQAVIPSASPRLVAIQGLRLASQGAEKAALPKLRSALNAIENRSAPADVQSREADLRLAYARSLYANGKNSEALAQYEKLFTIGKPMQEALLESAWTRLRDQNYAKAIGLSFEMQTGKMSRFFAPEASSIQAISFVENCRYADAKKSIEHFTSAYGPVVDWLNQIEKTSSLYELAMAKADGTAPETAIPDAVWSVWSGSDTMQAIQADIRALFKEESQARDWLSGSESLNSVTRTFVQGEINALKGTRARYAQLIENRLSSLNESMKKRIAQETERLRFVRIEMNQEAGRDLIYLNAHPEILKLEAAIRDQKPAPKVAQLRWGKAKVNDARAEMWIDEIGAFEGKSLSRCGVREEARTASNR